MRATLREAKASGRRLQMGHMIPRHQSRLVIATVTWTVQDHLSGANAVSGKLRWALLVESAMALLPLAQALTWLVEADHEVHPGLGLFAWWSHCLDTVSLQRNRGVERLTCNRLRGFGRLLNWRRGSFDDARVRLHSRLCCRSRLRNQVVFLLGRVAESIWQRREFPHCPVLWQDGGGPEHRPSREGLGYSDDHARRLARLLGLTRSRGIGSGIRRHRL